MANVDTLAGSIRLALALAHNNTQDDTSVSTDPVNKTITWTITDGTDGGKANAIFHERRTLTTGANYEYDLAGGLDDEFGTTLTFATIKAIIIHSTLAANKVLTIGAGTHPLGDWVGTPATDVVKLNAGGVFMLTAPNTGYTVVAGDTNPGDDLKITNAAGGSSTYDIIIIGTV